MYYSFHKNIKQQNILNTYIILISVSWAPKQHFRMISEGSCDTEDWSNDAEKSRFDIIGITLIWKYSKESKYFKLL